MAFNKFMHPRNIYKNNPPDFEELKNRYPDFKKYVKQSPKGKFFINFRNNEAVSTLFTSLIHHDFNLSVTLPDSRLSPTLPSRLNYIHFIEDLLLSVTDKTELSVILDIGCGCSCVYGLLGVTLNENWNFDAIEKDEMNYQCAVKNVKENKLTNRISVIKVLDTDEHFFHQTKNMYAACVCNPPFFNNFEEKYQSKTRPSANSSCSGCENELYFDGGDFAFGEKIYSESLKSPLKCIWFTTMLGKQKSFLKLKKKLKENKQLSVVEHELCQGNTMRWVLGWSFYTNLDLSRIPISEFQKERKKSKCTKPFVLTSLSTDKQTALNSFLKLISCLLEIEQVNDNIFKLKSFTKSWVGCRKRRRLNENKTGLIDKVHSEEVLVCLLNVVKCEKDQKFKFLLTCDNKYHEELNSLMVYLRHKLSFHNFQPYFK